MSKGSWPLQRRTVDAEGFVAIVSPRVACADDFLIVADFRCCGWQHFGV